MNANVNLMEDNMKHKLIRFSPGGDTAVAEWEETDEKAVEMARGAFLAARREGFQTVALAAGGGTAVEEFNPSLTEIIILERIAGG
jgi:hypothetical protein